MLTFVDMSPRYNRLEAGQRRDQMLDAANDLFAEHGYEDVSVEDIARAAGVTRGVVHHYFGGRAEVYVALAGAARRLPRGTAAAAGGAQRPCPGRGLGVTLVGLDRGEPPDLSGHHRTWRGPCRPRGETRRSRPQSPRRRPARGLPRRHRPRLAPAPLCAGTNALHTHDRAPATFRIDRNLAKYGSPVRRRAGASAEAYGRWFTRLTSVYPAH